MKWRAFLYFYNREGTRTTTTGGDCAGCEILSDIVKGLDEVIEGNKNRTESEEEGGEGGEEVKMLTMLLMTIDARVGALYNEILAGMANDAFFFGQISPGCGSGLSRTFFVFTRSLPRVVFTYQGHLKLWKGPCAFVTIPDFCRTRGRAKDEESWRTQTAQSNCW